MLLERALALMEEESGPVFLARVLAGLASAYAQSGRAADAGPLLERALAVGESVHLAQGRSLIVVQLGETRLAAGAVDEAAGLAAQALDLARAGGERGNEAWALHLAGEAAAARQPADVAEAQRLFAAAQALTGELDMRPLVARCRVSRGALTLAAGDPDDARASLGAALAELTAMGIDGWRAETAGPSRGSREAAARRTRRPALTPRGRGR